MPDMNKIAEIADEITEAAFKSVDNRLSWDDSKISDIELSAGYTITVFDTVDVTPYGEIHFNDSFATGDKIIGFKTSYKF